MNELGNGTERNAMERNGDALYCNVLQYTYFQKQKFTMGSTIHLPGWWSASIAAPAPEACPVECRC
jgi:hypothetical protein